MIYIAMADRPYFWESASESKYYPKNTRELLKYYLSIQEIRFLFQKVDQIILINFTKIKFDYKDLAKYCSEQPVEDRPLLETIKIFNLRDLGIIPVAVAKRIIENYYLSDDCHEYEIDMYWTKEMRLQPLKEMIQDKQIITASKSEFSTIFLKILSELDNVTIYRSSYRESGPFRYIPDTDIRGFYNFYKGFPSRKGKDEEELKGPTTFSECFNWKGFRRKRKACRSFHEDILKILDGTIKRVLFIGEDDLVLKYLFEELEQKFGCFIKQNAAGGNTDVNIVGDRIFISNADQLNAGIFNKIMQSITSDTQGDKIILLQNPAVVKEFRDDNFKVVLLPTTENLKELLPALLLFFIRKHIPESRSLIIKGNTVKLISSSPVLNIFRSIESIAEIENLIIEVKYKEIFLFYNFSDKVFWWEFYNYYHREKHADASASDMEKTDSFLINEYKDKTTEDHLVPTNGKTEKKVRFFHDKDAPNWVIYCHGFENEIETPFDQEQYMPNLAIKYMTYLVMNHKYEHGEGKKIEAAELYQICTKWNKNSDRIENPTRKNIYNEIYAFFKDNSTRNNAISPKRLAFRKKLGDEIFSCFKAGNYCFYSPKENLTIDVEDGDMPPLL